MSANPPCCPPQLVPAATAAEAGATSPLRGSEIRLPKSGARAYVVEPRDRAVKGAIIVFHDIFGFNSARTHHLCDELAEDGFLVIEPDFFRDAPLSDPKDFLSFGFFSKAAQVVSRLRLAWAAVETALREEVLPFIRQRTMAKIGGIGFCWGGWAVVRAAGTSPEPLIDCGVGAHPSILNQQLQSEGPTMDEMVLAAKVPILFAPGWTDPPSLREGGYYVKLLQKANKESKSVLFERQLHGFANRSDLRVPANLEDHKKFMRLTLSHFNQHLCGESSSAKL